MQERTEQLRELLNKGHEMVDLTNLKERTEYPPLYLEFIFLSLSLYIYIYTYCMKTYIYIYT